MEEKTLFSQYKYCKSCKKLLQSDYEFDECPTCVGENLFRQVRDYIRNNNVNEYEVADFFDLPVKRVKEWIREGRIQYQGSKDQKVLGRRCGRCGELIAIGDFCTTCAAAMKKPKATISLNNNTMDDSHMRFFGDKK